MPATTCPQCGYLIVNPALPCPSCGNKISNGSGAYNEGGRAKRYRYNLKSRRKMYLQIMFYVERLKDSFLIFC
jgi:uncharacterized membrane protein YvbJ